MLWIVIVSLNTTFFHAQISQLHVWSWTFCLNWWKSHGYPLVKMSMYPAILLPAAVRRELSTPGPYFSPFRYHTSLNNHNKRFPSPKSIPLIGFTEPCGALWPPTEVGPLVSTATGAAEARGDPNPDPDDAPESDGREVNPKKITHQAVNSVQ